MLKPLTTTVIGSYPIRPREEELLKSFYTQEDPYLNSIKTSVEDQLKAGVDIISDGQTRADIIKLFGSKIPGLKTNGRVEAIGELGELKESITARDQKYVLGMLGKSATGLQGIVTGPTTMVDNINPGKPYENKYRDFVLDMARALKSEVRFLEQAGVHYLKIDEPTLSIEIRDWESSKEALEDIAKGIRVPIGLHVCGNIGEVLPKLLELKNYSVLHFEFSTNPENLSVIKKYKFEKQLGFGCVNSADLRVEGVAEIKKSIEEALKFIEPEKLVINPDCGLRHQTRESALKKLKNMVTATKEIKKDLRLE